LENRFLDIYFCPFLKNENTFTKKILSKIREKAETIKKIKVSLLKNIFKLCDDKFLFTKLLKIFVLNLNLGIL